MSRVEDFIGPGGLASPAAPKTPFVFMQCSAPLPIWSSTGTKLPSTKSDRGNPPLSLNRGSTPQQFFLRQKYLNIQPPLSTVEMDLAPRPSLLFFFFLLTLSYNASGNIQNISLQPVDSFNGFIPYISYSPRNAHFKKNLWPT